MARIDSRFSNVIAGGIGRSWLRGVCIQSSDWVFVIPISFRARLGGIDYEWSGARNGKTNVSDGCSVGEDGDKGDVEEGEYENKICGLAHVEASVEEKWRGERGSTC